MAYVVAKTKEDGLAQIKNLVNLFKANHSTYIKNEYKETPLRSEFLDPFLMSLGWDVYNSEGRSQFLRFVIQEESIDVEGESSKKNPDYTLRIDKGERKLFVEAKKPSVKISKSSKSAFQIRRYGWNGNLGISVLSSFEELIIYDCRIKPAAGDDEHVARVRVFHFSDYIENFEEIYELISFESAYKGKIDQHFSSYERVGETFDSYFLHQIESWREELALSAIKKNKELQNEDINFLIQRLLNRIIFLRICEDRAIEKFETLKDITSYADLKTLFHQSDKKYNSGLFDFIEDSMSLKIEIESEVLLKVFNELYFPESPYDFSVVDSSILSQIYERFLGSRVEITEDRQLAMVMEPEVSASNGVVPTPKLVVEKIVKDTLKPLLDSVDFKGLKNLKIADICCGSGTFLISSFDYILEATISKLIAEDITDKEIVYRLKDGTYILTLEAKRSLLVNNIFGVDVNPYAVEVSEFSLLLKLLEGENKESVEDFISRTKEKILPKLSDNLKCGNSLVDNEFFKLYPEAIEDDDVLFRIKPFDWLNEFTFLNANSGFDAIVGNPPYVRIQNLVKYTPEEIKYYQSEFSLYSVAKKESIDKYYIFIQRAVSLLNDKGFLGYIVPHKFFLLVGGKALRKYILENTHLSSIIHFGVTQVFPERQTYTAILNLQKEKNDFFRFKKVNNITANALDSEVGLRVYNQEEFSAEPWIFLSEETESIFNKIYVDNTVPLKSVADVTVGLQTSADKIYIFRPEVEKEHTFQFTHDNKIWEIEKCICKPCIYDLSFGLFDTITENAKMIFPYVFESEKAIPIEESVLEESYPLAWEYFNYHKSKLVKRSINGSKDPKWYQFGRSQSLTKFHNMEKLIWTVLSTGANYILDKDNLQFTGGGNGPYYSLVNKSDYSILYLMALLSHPLIESMVKARASEFRGNYYSHGKQFINEIPIKLIKTDEEKSIYNSIVKTTKSLIEIIDKNKELYGFKKAVSIRKINLLKNSLYSQINVLYNITVEEVDLVVEELKNNIVIDNE